MTSALLNAEQLTKTYSSLGEEIHALKTVDVAAASREVVAVVGESGSGKSTLARLLIGLEQPSSGTISFNGARLERRRTRTQQRAMQIVFQDPRSSLNGHLSILESVEDFAAVHKVAPTRSRRRSLALAALERVQLDGTAARRRPSELSGGQLQRACIARALVVDPELLIADEPTSSLDVSIQGQILNLLDDLRNQLSILLITHDMAVVRFLADRVYVMKDGAVIEHGPSTTVLVEPAQPYTRQLLGAGYASDVDAGEP